MNRPVRIALSFFASATILVVLVWLRLREIEGLDPVAEAARIRDTTRMATLGLILAGGMAAGGFILLLISVRRARRQALGDRERDGDHG